MHLPLQSHLKAFCGSIYLLALLTNESINVNSADPDQTAPVSRSGSTLFDQESSKTFQQTTIAEFGCDWCF